MSRLRDRGGKKDRDRDRSGRNKRRRGDRMLHGSHREDGEDSSEESVDEDDEDEEEDSSVAVRLQPSPAQNPAPGSSGMQSHNIRKGYPVKPVRPPGTCTWKVAEEMIGAPIPRKARSCMISFDLRINWIFVFILFLLFFLNFFSLDWCSICKKVTRMFGFRWWRWWRRAGYLSTINVSCETKSFVDCSSFSFIL